MSRSEQQIILVHESRECGESTTKAYRKEHLHPFREIESTVKKAVDKPYHQTAENVDSQCAPWKHSSGRGLDELRQQVTGHPSETASGANDEDGVHLFIRHQARLLAAGEHQLLFKFVFLQCEQASARVNLRGGI